MKIYHLSDLHLHPTDEDYMKTRFDDFYENQSTWKEKWKSTITNDDIVLIGGDTIWGNSIKQVTPLMNEINNLPGHKKFIIRGNHCKGWYNPSTIRMMYNNIIPLDDTYYIMKNLILLGNIGDSNDKIKYHSRYDPINSIEQRLNCLNNILDIGNYLIILLLHYPPETEEMINLINKYKINVVLYGHEHYSPNIIEKIDNTIYIRNLCENLEFYPFHLNFIKYKDSNGQFRINKECYEN
jgi:predicted phosphohydrolase